MSKYDYDLADKLVTKYTTISLNDIINYTTTSVVGGAQIKLTFGYNSFNKKRWMVITDSGGNILLPQTFLAYGRRIYSYNYFVISNSSVVLKKGH